jgi:phage terminase small subunit
VFAIFCDLVDQAQRARELLGPALLLPARGGTLVTNPAWRIYRDMISEILALAREFGLTPSSRSSLRLTGLPELPHQPTQPPDQGE